MTVTGVGLEKVLLSLQRKLGQVQRSEDFCVVAVRTLGQALESWHCILLGPVGPHGQRRTLTEYRPAGPFEPRRPGYQFDLTSHNRCFGSLELYPLGTGGWQGQQLPLLEGIAQQISAALYLAEVQTQIQNLEQKVRDLEEANANQLTFLADISHELRTPLNTVAGMSKVLMQGSYGEVNDKQGQYLSSIYESADHSLQLVNSILDISKLNAERVALDIQEIDVPAACQQCLMLIEGQVIAKNLTVRLVMDERISLVWADELRLKQMLLNLLANAIKFTPPGAFIGLTVQPGQTEHGAECIQFMVWDTGIGIPEDQQQLLFQPFTQVGGSSKVRSQGTGLGLSITWKLAQLHGGRVWVDSAPGEGSRFTLELPMLPIQGVPLSDTPPQSKGRILLFEGNPSAAEALTDYLHFLGYEVTWVTSAQEWQNQLTQPEIALILMDSGLELLHWLKTQPALAEVPTIALVPAAMEQPYRAAGADRCLTKPLDLPLLRSVLNTF